MTPREQLRADANALGLCAGMAAEHKLGPFSDCRRAVAIHEAAHAVAGHFVSNPTTFISISSPPSDPQVAGYVLTGAPDFESCTIKIPHRTYITRDERQALVTFYIADHAATWKVFRARMKLARRRAEEFVVDHAFVIRTLADHLLVVGEMGEEDIRLFIASTFREVLRARAVDRLKELQRQAGASGVSG